MLRGCCKDVASSSSRHAPPRGPLRGCCSRNPTVLHGRGDESAAGEPDHCQSATCARSTSDEPIWMAQVELISNKPRLEPREGSLHHVFHHQAPTGQPGHGIGPHRHVGRGIHAHGGPGSEAVGPPSTPTSSYHNGFEKATDVTIPADGTTPGTEWVSNVTRVAGTTNGIKAASGTLVCLGGQGRLRVHPARWLQRHLPDQRLHDLGRHLPRHVAGRSVGTDLRFDWDSAISNASGGYGRDFVFNVGTNPAVAGRFLVSASNNADWATGDRVSC